MTALLPATSAEAGGRPAPRTSSAARWPVVAAAALLLAGLTWSAVLWAPSSVSLTAGRTSFGGDATVVTVPGYGLRGTHVVDFRDGAGLSVTVPVRNDGPLPLTVTSAATGAGVLPLLEVRGVEGLPLELGPGEEGSLVLQVVLTNCRYYHEREVQNVDGLVLAADVGVGPISRSTARTVPLDRPLLVHSPMIVGCPDRKINRQADNRRDAL